MPAYTNAKQTIPPLFQYIMANHAERESLYETGAITQAGWRRLRILVKEMKNLRIAAENALAWNTNKGNAV